VQAFLPPSLHLSLSRVFLLLTLEVPAQNAITAEGAAVLGALLRDVHSLQHLNIGNNRINEEGTCVEQDRVLFLLSFDQTFWYLSRVSVSLRVLPMHLLTPNRTSRARAGIAAQCLLEDAECIQQ